MRIAEDGIKALQNLGIRTEIDLRSDTEVINADYPLSEFAEYYRIPVKSYLGIIDNKEACYQVLQTIFSSILSDKPVYIHCWGGADRTGTIIALIEGLLGVSKTDIIKDYELTSFSCFGLREYGEGDEGESFKQFIDYIEEQYDGSSLQEQIKCLFIDLGFSEDEIYAFSQKMMCQ